MSQTIYVVTVGSYSDYRIAGVFSTKELAELFAVAINDGEVEEYELDPTGPEIRAGMKYFEVEMYRDGSSNVNDVHPEYGELQDIIGLKTGYSVSSVYEDVNTYKISHYVFCMTAYVVARDEQHAAKIANERRTQSIASGEWDRKRQEFDSLYRDRVIDLIVQAE